MTRLQAIRRVLAEAREAGDSFATVAGVIIGGAFVFACLFAIWSL